VLEAGSGEGYGADMIAGVATKVIGVDYDTSAVEHVRARYPRVEMIQGNLADLPLEDASVDVVVNFQVIEHLWDQSQFLRECLRVLRPGGELLISTPNRITFSPGRDTPLNPFHTRELNAAELTELLVDAGFEVAQMIGVHHGPGLKALDAKHGGSFIDAQIERALAGEPWPAELTADVASVTVDDFALVAADIDASLDLVAIAVKP
jgi:SAM-dependent methyltransferase